MTKEEIMDKLDAAGISYDRRLGAEKLAELLPAEKPASGKVLCTVVRDFWPEEGVRIRKGQIVELDPMEAIVGIEAGGLERVK